MYCKAGASQRDTFTRAARPSATQFRLCQKHSWKQKVSTGFVTLGQELELELELEVDICSTAKVGRIPDPAPSLECRQDTTLHTGLFLLDPIFHGMK